MGSCLLRRGTGRPSPGLRVPYAALYNCEGAGPHSGLQCTFSRTRVFPPTACVMETLLQGITLCHVSGEPLPGRLLSNSSCVLNFKQENWDHHLRSKIISECPATLPSLTGGIARTWATVTQVSSIPHLCTGYPDTWKLTTFLKDCRGTYSSTGLYGNIPWGTELPS